MSQLQVTGEAKIRDIQGPVIANSGVITALDGAASQYVRGDGTLADFPTSTGGGSSVSYYLNSSVSQGTIGGVAYRELSKEPIIGAGTDITISANGYVASYITDANDPDVLSVPGGNFNCEFYFSVNNNTGNPTTYAELYKYDGTTFTLLGTSVAVPESLNQGTTIAPYYFAIPVATAALALTDRLAIRIYVNVDGRVVTLHTENSHLCQVVTTFSKGMVSLNNLTDQSQFITTGTSGTNFAIVSSGDTHTFNLPTASATNTGKLSNTDWSTFNNKQAALSFTAPLVNTSNTISIPAATSLVDGYLDNADWTTFNNKQNAITLTTTGTSGAATLIGSTLNIPQYTDAYTGTVTSVAMTVPTGLSVSGSPITSSGTLAVSLASGYSIPTTTKQTEWDTAYTNRITSASFPLSISSNAILISLASASTAGYLSIADWNTFNGKQNALTNPVTGTGNSGYISLFTGTSAIGNSIIFQSTTRIGILTATPSTTLDVNGGGNFAGSLTALSLIKSGGTSSQFLKADGSVDSNTYITATSISAASPLFYNSGTGVFTISAATGSTNGYLSSADWLTFMAKQGAITLTTTGTSGAATLVGNTLNIPQYAAGVSGSGTTNYLPKFTGASTIGNSGVSDDGTSAAVGITIVANTGNLQVGGTANASLFSQQGTDTVRMGVRASGRTGISLDSSNATFTNRMWYLDNVGANGSLTIGRSGLDVLTFSNGGNLGLGVTPTYKLDVRGSSGAYWNGSIFTSTPLATSITNTELGGYDSVFILQQTDSGGTSKNAGAIGMVGTGPWAAGNNGTQVSDMYFLVRNDSGSISERMRIKSGGNVLIGTTTDAGYKLDVNGTGRFNGDLSITKSTAYATITTDATTGVNFIFKQGGVTKHEIFTNTTQFAIYNTTTAAVALGIANATGAATFSSNIIANGLYANAGNSARFYRGANDYYWGVNNDSNNYLNFGTFAANGTAYGTNPKMILLDNGNVGIGTSSPTNPLHIVSNTISQLNVAALSGNTNAQINLEPTGTGVALIGPASPFPLTFRTDATERMRITSAGNVGFNTSSPNALGGYTIYTFNTESTRTTGSIIDLNISGTRYSTLFTTTGGTYFGSNQNVPLILLTNGNESARITSGGNVLIGTTTDAGQKLQVNGITKTNGLSLGATTFSSSTTMTDGFFFWEFTGGAGVTLTMYNSSGNNNTHFIKNSSGVSVSIAAHSGGVIMGLSSGTGSSSITLGAYKTVQLISRGGSAWYIMYQTT